MKDKKPDIIIDANYGPVELFLNITLGSKVLIENDGGYFSSHPGRKIINGIPPHDCKKNGSRGMKGEVMTVLSFEKLQPGMSDTEKEIIVLTDGKYSYWFGYYNDDRKSWIKLIK